MKLNKISATVIAVSLISPTVLAAQSPSSSGMTDDGRSDVCVAETRNGAGWDNRALRPFIEGAWQMQAMGTRWTTGTKVDTVTISYDVGGRSFFISGGPKLKPLAAMPADHPLRHTDLLNMIIDGSEVLDDEGNLAINPNTGKPFGGFSLSNLAVMNGCADTTQIPMFFWGDASQWGFLAFTSSQFGFGQVGNSAGGSRNLSLER